MPAGDAPDLARSPPARGGFRKERRTSGAHPGKRSTALPTCRVCGLRAARPVRASTCSQAGLPVLLQRLLLYA